jgi:hypothetical protein
VLVRGRRGESCVSHRVAQRLVEGGDAERLDLGEPQSGQAVQRAGQVRGEQLPDGVELNGQRRDGHASAVHGMISSVVARCWPNWSGPMMSMIACDAGPFQSIPTLVVTSLG